MNQINLQNQNTIATNAKSAKSNPRHIIKATKLSDLAKSKKNNKISFYEIVKRQHLKDKLRVNKFKHRDVYENMKNAKTLEDFKNFEYNLYKQGLNLKKNLTQGVTEVLIKIFGKEQFDKYSNYIE